MENDGNAFVYQFQLDPNSYQWSGSINKSVWYKGDFVNIDDLPSKEQMEVRFYGNTLDNMKKNEEEDKYQNIS